MIERLPSDRDRSFSKSGFDLEQAMLPNGSKVTLPSTKDDIVRLMSETVIEPRRKLLAWSNYTRQTANMKIGYPGQHLSSLITGVEGTRTGARGHDLRDGTEVKSCSLIDQLDKCKDCKSSVFRMEPECPECGSQNINRKRDSKWLFTIRSDAELQQVIGYQRVLLIVGDYPGYDASDWETLRFRAFEIWPQVPQSQAFIQLMQGYYENIYLESMAEQMREKKGPPKPPAPKNLYPDTFQFYKCAPVKIFEMQVVASERPVIDINFWHDPQETRATLKPPSMPGSLLKDQDELDALARCEDSLLAPCLKEGISAREFREALNAKKSLKAVKSMIAEVHPDALQRIPLRATDKASRHSTPYSRPAIL